MELPFLGKGGLCRNMAIIPESRVLVNAGRRSESLQIQGFLGRRGRRLPSGYWMMVLLSWAVRLFL